MSRMVFLGSILLLSVLLQGNNRACCSAFAPYSPTSTSPRILTRRFSTTSPRGSSSKASSSSKEEQPKKKRQYTLKDLRDEIQQKPTAFLQDTSLPKKKSNYRRSRKRVERPQQQYVYAKQRRANVTATADAAATTGDDSTTTTTAESSVPIALAKEYGLVNPSAQHCDPLVDNVEPQILGQIQVGGDDASRSGNYAYVIHKPAGWAILGGGGKTTSTTIPSNNNIQQVPAPPKKKKGGQKVRLEFDGSSDVLEYNEADLLAVMTPEEVAEYKAEQERQMEELQQSSTGKATTQKVRVRVDLDDDLLDDEENDDDEGLFEGMDLKDLELAERELLAQLSPEELAEYEAEIGPLPEDFQMSSEQQQHISDNNNYDDEENHDHAESSIMLQCSKNGNEEDQPTDPKVAEILSKIEARTNSAQKSSSACFSSTSRPSLVTWLKDLKAQEGNPMKGGNYWTALAGATSVDDSGIVILCPKEYVDNVFVDYLEYVAVVGNGNNVAPKPKGVVSVPKKEMTMDVLSTVRRGRADDAVQTVKVMVNEKFSSCSSIIHACQQQFQDGIRGDPAGNPLGRLANRRLVHCNAVSVSSLVFDESLEVETEGVPDDIAILAERRNQHQYKQGSFLGRSALRDNPLTTAYREINGAADGFPGWTVDRYSKWLLVQHDDKMPRGPLPSIHDGFTAGVYYLPANPDRGAMGSSKGPDASLTRPTLLEGQPAPEIVDILENGITYHVSLDKDLSTGLFLDQRPQRAWLARNCNADTHVLNCFAHCGGFSIAAATAGASTTSIDLSKKWLDRIEPQLKANGIDFDQSHDCIYGDCTFSFNLLCLACLPRLLAFFLCVLWLIFHVFFCFNFKVSSGWPNLPRGAKSTTLSF